MIVRLIFLLEMDERTEERGNKGFCTNLRKLSHLSHSRWYSSIVIHRSLFSSLAFEPRAFFCSHGNSNFSLFLLFVFRLCSLSFLSFSTHSQQRPVPLEDALQAIKRLQAQQAEQEERDFEQARALSLSLLQAPLQAQRLPLNPVQPQPVSVPVLPLQNKKKRKVADEDEDCMFPSLSSQILVSLDSFLPCVVFSFR
jgi:hypothetical protein